MSKAQKPSLEIDEPWLAQRMKQLEEELKKAEKAQAEQARSQGRNEPERANLMQSEHYAVIAGGAALRAAQRLNLVTWLLAFVTAAQFVITAVPFFFPRH